MNATPCVFFALARESQALKRLCRNRSYIPDAPCSAWRGQLPGADFLALETGVGPHAASRAFEWLINFQAPTLVLSAGFCGALEPGLSPGMPLWAREVVTESNEVFSCLSRPERIAAIPGMVPIPEIRLLTSSQMIGNPTEKRRQGQDFQAQAVDMEAGILARLCQSAGIPFACLRTVSDAWDTPLSPRLLDLLQGGRVSPWKFTWSMVRQPSLVGECLRLAKATRRASEALGAALAHFLAPH